MSKELLRRALAAMGGVSVECKDLHHPKRDQMHPHGECGPLLRYAQIKADLRAAIDAPEVAGWVAVGDRLPEKGRTPVLVAVAWIKYEENEDGSPAHYEGVDVTEGEYVPANGEVGGYMDSFQGTHGDSSHVTHWMQLPEPPSAAAISETLQQTER